MPELRVVVVVVVVGLAVGAVRGGRMTTLGHASLPGGGLVATGLVAAVAGQLLALGSWPWMVALAALLGAAWRNRLRPGTGLVAAGLLMNAAVITANGGMPVSTAAAAAVGGAVVADGLHVTLAPGDPLGLLADVVAVGPLEAVLSAGDLVLAAGAGVLMGDAMGAGRGARRGLDGVSRRRSATRRG